MNKVKQNPISDTAELFLEVIPLAVRRLRKEFRESSGTELTVPQLRVISHVFRGVDTALELANLQGVSSVAISKMINTLVKKGYLKRTFHEENRKQQILCLTADGRERFLKLRGATHKEVAKKMGKAEAKTMEEIQRGLLALQKLLQSWET